MKAQRQHTKILSSLVVISLLSVAACTKFDDYKKFGNEKEVIYIGKADSIELLPGKNRIGFTMKLADPKVSRVVIYWSNKADSVVIPITNKPGIDNVTTIIPNLAAGTYNFIIYTYDDSSNKSVPVNISGRAYGDVYEKALLNRPILSAYRWSTTPGPLFIIWDRLDTTTSNVYIAAKITYKDNTGASNTQLVKFDIKNDTSLVSLPANVAANETIEYTTLIKPDKMALDTFYAPKQKIIYNTVAPPSNMITISEAVSKVINVDFVNTTIDKANLTFTKTLTLARLKLGLQLDYSVDVQVSNSVIPVGTQAINLADVSLTSTSGTPISILGVQANQATIQFNITVPKSVLDANPGKKMAFSIDFYNLASSGFNVSGLAYSASFVIDVDGFSWLDMTSNYILNPGGVTPFKRSDSGTGQFGTIKDWKINKWVNNNNPGLGKRGFSTNNEVGGGYMYASRLSGENKPTEGKIYQNIALPAGKYMFEMDFKEIVFRDAVTNNAYFLSVSANDTLPGTGLNDKPTSNPRFPGIITDGIAHTRFDFNTYPEGAAGNTKTVYNKIVTMPFDLADPKTVSLGFVISIQNTNPYFFCRGVKLKKFITPFN